MQSLRFAGELDGDDVLFGTAKAVESSLIEQPAAPTPIPLQTVAGGEMETYYLTLDASGKRRVIIQAPPAVTAAELKRIQDWLSFQLLITQNELNEPE